MSGVLSFDSRHYEAIHDAKLDYYGRLLATASSDHTIKIFEVSGEQHSYLATLELHTGPVWQVAWANPKSMNMKLLASCGYDRKIIIWQDLGKNNWKAIYEKQDAHKSSVNSIEFAPPEYGVSGAAQGPMLLAGSSDEHVSIHRYDMNSRRFQQIGRYRAHVGGVNAVSWSTQHRVSRFATGGSDGHVKIWQQVGNGDTWEYSPPVTENGHTDWVRDVAWAPSPSQSSISLLASCSEDQTVKIWTERGFQWTVQQTIPLEKKAWSVSWSTLGNVLAVATTDQVLLYKENSDGKFTRIE